MVFIPVRHNSVGKVTVRGLAQFQKPINSENFMAIRFIGEYLIEYHLLVYKPYTNKFSNGETLLDLNCQLLPFRRRQFIPPLFSACRAYKAFIDNKSTKTV